MHNVRVASQVLFGAKWGLQPGRQHVRELWETAPKRYWGKVHICDFGEGGVHIQLSTNLTKGFLLVMRSWCNHEGSYWFSRYEEMQGLGSGNRFLKISNYLKTCSPSFPGAHSSSFSTLTPFRACWRSIATAAQDSVSSEADGKCPWQAPICSWHF